MIHLGLLHFGEFSKITFFRYQNARHVYLNDSKAWIEVDSGPNSVNSLTENRAVAKNHRKNTKQKIKRRDLIFSSNATDYCNYDPAQGSLGTAGRRCSRENAE